MNTEEWTWRRVAAAAVVLGIAGCAATERLGEAPAEPVVIDVRVIGSADCALNLPAESSGCNGVGRSDGVACGRNGDTVRWVPQSDNVVVRSITFPEGNEVVCEESPSTANDMTCVLREQPGASPQRGVAFKYLIGVNFRGRECAEQDPYLIVTRR
jgi:hypothetical protein